MSKAETPMAEIKMDQNNLYREDLFTDMKVGQIKRLTPVNVDGTTDKSRQVLFVGQTQVVSELGPMPISHPIEANSLAHAVQAFPTAMQQGLERLVQEVQELRRQEASRIVVPGVETTKKILT